MVLRDPVAVFNADTNLEAQLVRTLLVDAGIEAFAVEDVSYVGTCAFGTLPEINKPQVWVERADVEKAWKFLDDYEGRVSERKTAHSDSRFCYQCGEQVSGGDSTCAACGQSLGPPDDAQRNESNDAAREGSGVEEEEPGDVSRAGLAPFRGFKKPLAWLVLLCVAGPVLLAILRALAEFVRSLVGGLR
jgi:hypothetical protein